MMTNVKDIKRGIGLLCAFPNFNWTDFGDRGIAGMGRLDIMDDPNEITADAIMTCYVKMAMPKDSELHSKLSGIIAGQLGCKWVTYDWLVKVLSRIFRMDTSRSYEEFRQWILFCAEVKARMNSMSLTEIDDLSQIGM